MELPEDSALILVAIIPSPKDLEIARLLGWYRIPLRTAPKLVSVDYLAFYQPAKFGSQGSMIAYFAKVTGHELTTRESLFKDENTHSRAKDTYYKIQIGSLVKLQNPIRAEKWHRITFLYTTGAYFRTATIINDLVVQNEDRKDLWRSLRERSSNSLKYDTSYNIELPEDPKLLALLGIIPGLKPK